MEMHTNAYPWMISGRPDWVRGVLGWLVAGSLHKEKPVLENPITCSISCFATVKAKSGSSSLIASGQKLMDPAIGLSCRVSYWQADAKARVVEVPEDIGQMAWSAMMYKMKSYPTTPGPSWAGLPTIQLSDLPLHSTHCCNTITNIIIITLHLSQLAKEKIADISFRM